MAELLKKLLKDNFSDPTIPVNLEELERRFGDTYMSLAENEAQITNAIMLKKTYQETIKPLYSEYLKAENLVKELLKKF